MKTENTDAEDTQHALPVVDLKDIYGITGNKEDFAWEHFRDGVEIHRLYGDGITGPTAALLHFRERAPIPPHIHEGYEHIIVLSGSQQDNHGTISKGSLRIHAPGTVHEGVAEAGCLILAIYERPVTFL